MNNTESSPNEIDLCPVCHEEIQIYALGQCNHPICYRCSVRMRVLCEQMYCPICRSDIRQVVFLNKCHKFESINMSSLCMDRKVMVFSEDTEIQDQYQNLLKHRCNTCQPPREFETFSKLKYHMSKDHKLMSCKLCADNLKLFSHERKFYETHEMVRHKKMGDPDDKSYKGHPLCKFCDERYFDIDVLVLHLRKDHFYCHFCEADGKTGEFFCIYDDLKKHFKDEHYLCEEGDCSKLQWTNAFRSDIDFKAHIAQAHSKGLDKHQTKRLKTLDLEFNQPDRNNWQRGERMNRDQRNRDDFRMAQSLSASLNNVQRQGHIHVANQDVVDILRGRNANPVQESAPLPSQSDFPVLNGTVPKATPGASNAESEEQAQGGSDHFAVKVGKFSKYNASGGDFPLLPSQKPAKSNQARLRVGNTQSSNPWNKPEVKPSTKDVQKNKTKEAPKQKTGQPFSNGNMEVLTKKVKQLPKVEKKIESLIPEKSEDSKKEQPITFHNNNKDQASKSCDYKSEYPSMPVYAKKEVSPPKLDNNDDNQTSKSLDCKIETPSMPVHPKEVLSLKLDNYDNDQVSKSCDYKSEFSSMSVHPKKEVSPPKLDNNDNDQTSKSCDYKSEYPSMPVHPKDVLPPKLDNNNKAQVSKFSDYKSEFPSMPVHPKKEVLPLKLDNNNKNQASKSFDYKSEFPSMPVHPKKEVLPLKLDNPKAEPVVKFEDFEKEYPLMLHNSKKEILPSKLVNSKREKTAKADKPKKEQHKKLKSDKRIETKNGSSLQNGSKSEQAPVLTSLKQLTTLYKDWSLEPSESNITKKDGKVKGEQLSLASSEHCDKKPEVSHDHSKLSDLSNSALKKLANTPMDDTCTTSNMEAENPQEFNGTSEHFPHLCSLSNSSSQLRPPPGFSSSKPSGPPPGFTTKTQAPPGFLPKTHRSDSQLHVKHVNGEDFPSLSSENIHKNSSKILKVSQPPLKITPLGVWPIAPEIPTLEVETSEQRLSRLILIEKDQSVLESLKFLVLKLNQGMSEPEEFYSSCIKLLTSSFVYLIFKDIVACVKSPKDKAKVMAVHQKQASLG